MEPRIGEMVHFVVWSVCKPALWVSDAKLYIFDDPGAYYMPILDYESDAWHTITDCPNIHAATGALRDLY